MPMPKIRVNKNNYFLPSKNYIWLANNSFNMMCKVYLSPS